MPICLSVIDLYSHQIEALEKLHNGCVLCGDVGSGKSRTALAYYFLKECDGSLKINGEGGFKDMTHPRDLYIITTAKKRDSLEWEEEALPFCLDNVKVTIDSWNNIKKYVKVYGAFFIFDEQRVVGKGAWTKAFYKITCKNKWILLSATPGDTWSDYIPLFVANGFYKNRTEFNHEHVVYDRFVTKYPKIDHYENEGQLISYRNRILVTMADKRETKQIHINVSVEYNKQLYLQVLRKRWDPYDNEPIAETGKLFYLMRRVVNSDPSRIQALDKVMDCPKVIIFYNFTYELEMLREYLEETCCPYAEWNGEKHEPIPDTPRWAYLVQYSAGAEGWNCIETDTMCFFSQSYSYRMTKQAAGRIDRMNTPFKELHYYHLISKAPIDIAIRRALAQKRNFNEKSFKI